MKHKRRIGTIFHDLLHYEAVIAQLLEASDISAAQGKLMEMADYTREELLGEMQNERKSDS